MCFTQEHTSLSELRWCSRNPSSSLPGLCCFSVLGNRLEETPPPSLFPWPGKQIGVLSIICKLFLWIFVIFVLYFYRTGCIVRVSVGIVWVGRKSTNIRTCFHFFPQTSKETFPLLGGLKSMRMLVFLVVCSCCFYPTHLSIFVCSPDLSNRSEETFLPPLAFAVPQTRETDLRKRLEVMWQQSWPCTLSPALRTNHL